MGSSSERFGYQAEDSQSRDDGDHYFVLTRRTEHVVEWTCPTCDRQVRLEVRPRRFTIVKPGEQLVNHGGGSSRPGISLRGAVDAQPGTDTIH